MQIQIGKIKFGEGTDYHIAPNIQGLDSASIRTSSGLYAGVDGGYVSAQLYGHRTITFQGFILGDCEEQEAARKTLFTTLKIKTYYPVGIITFNEKAYATSGYITDIKSSITSPTASEFQITILCPDPILYEADIDTPATPSWIQQELPGETRTTINVPGTAMVYPVLSTAPASTQTQIQFYNYTTGQTFWLKNLGGSTTTVTVDMGNRTVLQGSQSLASLRDIASRWWGLEPGNNQLGHWTNNVAGRTATIRFKTGYQGI